MADFDPAAKLRALNFQVFLVPGTTQVQSAVANYEVVLPSGRPIQLQAALNLVSIQATVDAASAVIISQLLTAEGLGALWQPPAPV